MSYASYAAIIPLLRLPRSLGIFDYKIPDAWRKKVKIGQPVEIIFRGQRQIGIIFQLLSESPNAKLELSKILYAEPIIDEERLRLFCDLAREACVSPALFLKQALPEIPRRITNIVVPSAPADFTYKSTNDSVQKILVAWGKEGTVRLRLDDADLARNLLLALIGEALELKNQLLILFPLQEQAASFYRWLKSKNAPVELTLPQDSKIRTYTLWRAFARKHQLIVVGTRGALFFPMTGGRYVLIDEVAEEWKQSEMNPRIDARQILPRLAQKVGAQTVVLTPLCLIENSRTCQDLRLHPAPPTVVIKLQAGQIFSDVLIKSMTKARRALFFAHRRGRAALLRCSDCGFTAECKICGLMLAVHKNYLRCTACGTRSELPLICPKCQGTNLKNYGIGSEQVQEEAEQTFPDTKIEVRTQIFLNHWPITETVPRYDLVAVVEADTILHRPDIRSKEKLSRIVNRLRQIAAFGRAPFIVQTAFPDFMVWTAGDKNDKNWIADELRERELLHLPPVWRAAKIILQNKDENALARDTHTIFENLNNTLASWAEISQPYSAIPPQVRGQYRQLILVKFPRENSTTVIDELRKLPDSTVIDIDAIDFLR